MKCKVCKKRFKPSKENKYIVCESKSVLDALAKGNKAYDAFDCPFCGCQHVVGVRMEMVEDYDKN